MNTYRKKDLQLLPRDQKEFIKNSYYRLKVLGINAFASGAFLTMAVNNFSHGNTTAAVLSGLTAGVTAFVSANEGFRLGSRIKRLSDENTKLQETNQ